MATRRRLRVPSGIDPSTGLDYEQDEARRQEAAARMDREAELAQVVQKLHTRGRNAGSTGDAGLEQRRRLEMAGEIGTEQRPRMLRAADETNADDVEAPRKPLTPDDDWTPEQHHAPDVIDGPAPDYITGRGGKGPVPGKPYVGTKRGALEAAFPGYGDDSDYKGGGEKPIARRPLITGGITGNQQKVPLAGPRPRPATRELDPTRALADQRLAKENDARQAALAGAAGGGKGYHQGAAADHAAAIVNRQANYSGGGSGNQQHQNDAMKLSAYKDGAWIREETKRNMKAAEAQSRAIQQKVRRQIRAGTR